MVLQSHLEELNQRTGARGVEAAPPLHTIIRFAKDSSYLQRTDTAPWMMVLVCLLPSPA